MVKLLVEVQGNARFRWVSESQAIYPYKFALTSAFGCNTVSFLATDDAGAQACAQGQCINCIVTPGDCP
jgi:hypothetical protein